MTRMDAYKDICHGYLKKLFEMLCCAVYNYISKNISQSSTKKRVFTIKLLLVIFFSIVSKC